MPQVPSGSDEQIHRTLQRVITQLAAEGWAPAEQLKEVRRRLLHQLGSSPPHTDEEAEAPGLATMQDEARSAAFLGSDAAKDYSGSPIYWRDLHDWYVWWKLAHDDEFWQMLEQHV